MRKIYTKTISALIAIGLVLIPFAPVRAITCGFGSDIGGGVCRGFLTSTAGGLSFTVPADWNSANNTIEVIGGGAGGGSTNAGGGGAYSKVTNVSYTPASSKNYQVGAGGPQSTANNSTAGGDTWFDGTSLGSATVSAQAGQSATGGAAGSGIGSTKYSGGSQPRTFSGGGGAAGPNGDGGNSTTCVGAGGAPGIGGTGDAGFGGAGGASNSADGQPGTEWDGSHGSGGGGATANCSANSSAGSGGLYGAGGGNAQGGGNSNGNGAQGIIVITYTPAAAAVTSNFGYLWLFGF